jgi:xanthine dehydrogenase YagT iron-sulfur-binding subunit
MTRNGARAGVLMIKEEEEKQGSGLSRRQFMKLGGLAATVPMVVGPTVLTVAGEEVEVYGPGVAQVTLTVNGKPLHLEVEPRVTLLDALREKADLTGAKRVCDRGTCGACTVLLDGKPVYACSMLALDAQGRQITTVEGISTEEQLTALQKAIVENDGQQCGFCTPGFVVSATAMLAKHKAPTDEDIRRHMSGNLCRCGTYHGMRAALHQMAGGNASRKGA